MTTTQTPVPLEDKYDPKLGTHYSTSRDFPSYVAGLPVLYGDTAPVGSHQENMHLLFYLSTLCFTPPENEFGNQFLDYRFLVDFSTLSLVRVQKSKSDAPAHDLPMRFQRGAAT